MGQTTKDHHSSGGRGLESGKVWVHLAIALSCLLLPVSCLGMDVFSVGSVIFSFLKKAAEKTVNEEKCQKNNNGVLFCLLKV